MSDPSAVPALSRALHRIRSTPPRIIASPATQQRRAAVAIILRVAPGPLSKRPPSDSPPPSLSHFFSLDWVNDSRARAEILFLRREQQSDKTVAQHNPRHAQDAHVAFPGGRTEDGDEGALYTAMRQTWEEIGVDLAEKDFLLVGQLDDREITTSLGKRLLMILSPFVFLQVSQTTPSPDPIPGTHLHWIPLPTLLASASSPPRSAAEGALKKRTKRPIWSTVTVDVSSRLTPRHATFLRFIVRMLIGSMQFNAILLDSVSDTTNTGVASSSDEKNLNHEKGNSNSNSNPNPWVASSTPHARGHEQLKLWGLSLGMTLDLIAYMLPPSTPFSTDLPQDEVIGLGTSIAPSMTSVFPRFSYPDVNFWIWVFGKRYREVVRSWEISARAGGANDRRINWIGTAVNQFYASVRKALVVVLVLRAIGILIAFGISGWWVFLH